MRLAELPPPSSPTPEVTLSEREARRVDLIWSGGMVAALALLFLLLTTVRGVAVPVLLSLAFAYVWNPVVTWLSRKGIPRPWATTLVFAGLGLLLTGAGFYLVPAFRDEIAKLPEFVARVSRQVVPKLESVLGVSVPEFVRERTAQLGDEASNLLKSVGPAAAGLLGAFAGNTARVIATILGLLVVPVLGFFFLTDYPRLVEKARALLPRRSLPLVGRRFSEVDDVLSAFVRGQLTVGAILSVIYSVGLSFARIDLAIVIGVIAGFGNMVPYVGTSVGVVLALLGMVLSYQGAWQLAFVAGTFIIAQAAEGLVITPRVVGDKVGLPPVAVIIAVLAFGEMFGFVGILLAVPTSAILKVVLRVVIERYQKTRFYTGSAPTS